MPPADSQVKVPISPVIAVLPVPGAASQPAIQSQGGSIASALQQAVQQNAAATVATPESGKPALDVIAQIAAGVDAKPKRRQRDPGEQREETPEQRARRHPLLALF